MANITDKWINSKPTTAHQWASEPAIWGHGSLVVRITPTGERLFYFRYLNATGGRITMPIGTYGEADADGCLTLAGARVRATTLASLHKSGIRDIQEHFEGEETARVAARDADIAKSHAAQAAADAEIARIAARKTVREVFTLWMATDIRKRKDGGAAVLRMFSANVFPIIGEKAIADLTKGDVTEVIDRILARDAKEMARDTLSAVQQMLNFAVDRDHIPHNPATSLKAKKLCGKKVERDRVLSEDEIRELVQKLPQAGLLTSTEAALWIALSTCCRIGELLSARWEHVDLEASTWFMPNTKNGKSHTVQLSDFAIAQFRRLQVINGNSEWCYPNTQNTNHVCEKSVTKQIGDRQVSLKDRKELKNRRNDNSLVLDSGKNGDWTPHDLRRTGATMMTVLKVLPVVAEKCLNHTEENKVTRTYLLNPYTEEMRKAWRKLGGKLEVLTRTDCDNVVTFQKKTKQ